SIINSGTLKGANYYVDSLSGNDSKPGTSPEIPWKSISRVNSASFKPTDTIKFNRSGTWREQLIADSGDASGYITYTAYGTGDGPKLLGSINLNNDPEWVSLGGNLWKNSNSSLTIDVGNLIFNNESGVGFKKWSQADLKAQGDFWYDRANDAVVMYSSGNPGAVYSNIEAALRRNIINADNYNIIEKLHVMYGGYMGIEGVNNHHMIIRDNHISYIGGGDQFQDGRTVRLGNGIQFWNNASDIIVERNIIDNIYDAGVTNQYNGTASGVRQENIIYRNNILSNCEFSFELFNTSTGGTLTGIRIENNTSINAGGAWSHNQRPTPDGKHLRLGTLPAVYDVVIKNNIFYNTTHYFIRYSVPSNMTKYVLDNNIYGGSYVNFAKSGNSTLYPTFSNYKSATGQDAHSLLTDPLLDADFKLTPDSPAINKGATLSDVTDDFTGASRPVGGAYDIGAYEYGAIPPDPEPDPDPDPLPGDYIFTGAGNWSDTSLWSSGVIPGADSIVLIDGIATLTSDVFGLNLLTINSGRSLDLSGFDIGTINGIINNGTLRLLGPETITGGLTNNHPSAVEYLGSGSYSTLTAGNSYCDLTFKGTGSWTLADDVNIHGNLLIDSGHILSANNKNIALSGDWTNNGTFNAGTGTVILNGDALQLVKTGGQASAFNTLTINNTSSSGIQFTDALYANTLNAVNGVKRLSFAPGSGITHTIASGFNVSGQEGSLLELSSSAPGQTWYLDAPVSTVEYVNVSDSSQAAGKLITANNSVDSGNNAGWDFGGILDFIFSGTGNWLDRALWSSGVIPGANDTVTIDGFATLNTNVLGLESLTINPQRSLNLAGFNLGTVNGLTNNGTLYLLGSESITGNIINNPLSAVEYKGSGTYASLAAGDNYYNLSLKGAGSWTLANDLNIGKDLLIDAGNTLAANKKTITIAGNWTNNGGFANNSGRVIFDGESTIGGTQPTAFSSVNINPGKILNGPAGGAIYISGWLTNSGTFNGNLSTVNVNGYIKILGSGTNLFHNLTILPGKSLTLLPESGIVSVSGNWTNDNIFNANSQEVILNGDALQLVKTGGQASAFNTLTINNTSSSGIQFTDALYATTL
ncbi:MAG: choice-of-anchor Q domain-containing protein, partial [Candidatus Omnitrophota bacterium]